LDWDVDNFRFKIFFEVFKVELDGSAVKDKFFFVEGELRFTISEEDWVFYYVDIFEGFKVGYIFE